MGERIRVLVVDDEEGIRLGVTRVLERFVASFPDIAAEISYDVESAASGEDAVERLRDAPPDILLLDLKLPGIGGLDVLREARNLDPPVHRMAGIDFRLGVRHVILGPFLIGLEPEIRVPE